MSSPKQETVIVSLRYFSALIDVAYAAERVLDNDVPGTEYYIADMQRLEATLNHIANIVSPAEPA